MNRLPFHKRQAILHQLVEGASLRTVSRVVDVSFNTVLKLQVDAGKACAAFHDKRVRDVRAERVQCDEIWSFCYAKDKNVEGAKAAPEGAGDVWTWTALDPQTKLIISYAVGCRGEPTARAFMRDLHGRLAGRVQLTTDGHSPYLEAVERSFGAGVDYAMLVKEFKSDETGIQERRVEGEPDPEHISTSHVERQNLNMRMGMRRYTRRTNAFSKKVENHRHSCSLYFVYYNFVRRHQTLRMTPAMRAGLTRKWYDMEWLTDLVEKAQPKARRPRRYKKARPGAPAEPSAKP